VLGLDPIADGTALKRRIGLMLQGGGVYPQIRPLEVLRLYAAFYPYPQNAEALLARVGLADARKTPFRRLSGGQKQRLSLALAVVGRPEVVFLDEPTAAMDPQARRATWEIIRELKDGGVTVLLTTHSMDEAERLADRIAIIDRGRLVALDTAGALRRAGGAAVVRFRAVAGLDTADLAAALGAPVLEVEPGVYAVRGTPTPGLIARLAGWLSERDVLLAELHVGQRSLEEVYLRLTGDGGARAGS
jgi:ABC-2 type transport system ATP-binding protein